LSPFQADLPSRGRRHTGLQLLLRRELRVPGGGGIDSRRCDNAPAAFRAALHCEAAGSRRRPFCSNASLARQQIELCRCRRSASSRIRHAPISIAIGEGLRVRVRRTQSEIVLIRIARLLSMSCERQRHSKEQHATSKEFACHIEISNLEPVPTSSIGRSTVSCADRDETLKGDAAFPHEIVSRGACLNQAFGLARAS
jgi:hypothetical protein